jgi:MFS family permease
VAPCSGRDIQPAGRSNRALLFSRDFGPFFWGNSAATLGTWAYNIAAVVLVFQLTGSPQAVGLVTIAQFAAPLLLAPVGGSVADRFDRRRLLIGAQATSAAAAGALALAVKSAEPQSFGAVWAVFLVSFVMGASMAVADPARQALIPSLVPQADMGSAIALNSVTFNLGRAIGPAVAGLLLVSHGPWLVFGVAASGCLLSAVALLTVHPRPQAERPLHERGMTAGVRYVLADRRQLALLVGVGAAGFGSDPVITLAPLLARELTSGSESSWGGQEELAVGLLASSFGCGAISAVLGLRWLHARWGYRLVGLQGMTMLASMLLVLALRPGLAVSCGLLFLAGTGYFLAVTSLTTLLQAGVPDHLRGRLMALWGALFLGSRPVAAFMDSNVAEALSPQAALVAVTVVVGRRRCGCGGPRRP